MKTHYTAALSMLAGIGVGAVAVHGLHAQAKPPAYVITETISSTRRPSMSFRRRFRRQCSRSAGIVSSLRGGRVVTLQGEAPQRFIVTAFDSMEKAQAWRD